MTQSDGENEGCSGCHAKWAQSECPPEHQEVWAAQKAEWDARPVAVVEMINCAESKVIVSGENPDGAGVASYYSRDSTIQVDGTFRYGAYAQGSSFTISGRQTTPTDGQTAAPVQSRRQRRAAERASRKKTI